MHKRFLTIVFILMIFFASGCTNNNASPDPVVSGGGNCASCHNDVVTRYETTSHGQADLSCSDCHNGLEAHIKSARNLPTIDMRGNTCASCHTEEHTQWAASPHAKIPLDLFPNDPRIMQCMKCHQSTGFAAVIASGQDFKSSWGPAPEVEPEPVTCVACHSPHQARDTQMLRLPKGELCATCHGGKWQNQLLTATPTTPYVPPGEHKFGQSYTPPAQPNPDKYVAFANHPHNGSDRCVTCHMAQTPGIDSLGGHTFSMRAKDGALQNIAACVACHDNVESYDINGKQTEVKEELSRLESALKQRNNGALPGNQPGTCNQCHKGGSLPFDNDSDFILSNAYETYKQIDRDKSLGVHNAPFALQVLREAIESIETKYKP